MININEITFVNGNNAFITDKETHSQNLIKLSDNEMFWHQCSHERAIEYFSTIVKNYQSLSTKLQKNYFDAYLQIIDTNTEVGIVLSMSEDISNWNSILF